MEQKKKILFCVTKGNFGGAQRYVFDLAVNLPKDRFETIVTCGTKDGTSLVEKLEEKNIKTIKLEGSEREINLKNDFKTIKDLIKIIKEEKPNIVHFNSSKIGLLGSLAVLFLKLSAPSSKLKAIFTAHGWAFNEQKRSFFSKMIFYAGHYLTVLICDKTIAVSQKTKRDIAFLPFIKNKIKVVYNGITNFETLPKKEARSALAGKKENRKIIYSMSELHHNKGLDVALRGLALLPNKNRSEIIYCLAGRGEEEPNLRKLAEELNINDAVNFLGFVSDSKKFLSGADIFLFPSRTENLPFAILEAGLKGLPIIATSVGGVPEVLRDMQNGILVHSKNPKEIAEAILYYLDHSEKQKEFGEEIKKTITNFFSLEKMISETISLYSKLLALSS